MDYTFITIHNLGPEANILFVSDSITEILGYRPHEVQGRSCFDFFHPDEVPFARWIHNRGVLLDKAAVLHYARVASRAGDWVSCECVFTVVHDVIVACTSVYRHSHKSERRAVEAPQVRRMFSSSAKDPRYHMLEHLSAKFRMPPAEREPRAALILNRFTRTLSVMFSTPAVAGILGISPDELQHKSFYDCIAPNCLADATRCLESAKANDSIAYLRFWFRDPRRVENMEPQNDEPLHTTTNDETSSTSDESEGGAPIDDPMEVDMSSLSGSNRMVSPSHRSPARQRPLYIELEAVVSCTSDGLVVILRKARPPLPSLQPPRAPVQYRNGLFAAPWAPEPVHPLYTAQGQHESRSPMASDHMPPQAQARPLGGPMMDHLMQSIRDVAVFAWAVVGINNNLSAYSRGIPSGEAQPHGLPSSSSSSSGNQPNGNDSGSGSGYWSLESRNDAELAAGHRPSDVSSTTSQLPSNARSNEVSPYISDDGTTMHGSTGAAHHGLPSVRPHAAASTLRPYDANDNHGHAASRGDMNGSGGGVPGPPNWQPRPDGIDSMQPPAHGLLPSQTQTSAEGYPSEPAK